MPKALGNPEFPYHAFHLKNHEDKTKYTYRRNKDELISDVQRWTPPRGHAIPDRPATTDISSVQTLDMSGAMNDMGS